MPVFKDISCSIQIGSSTLQEYDDVGDDQSSQSPVTKVVYVEAQESATFSIICEVLPSYVYDATAGNRVSFRVYINGRAYCRKSINAEKPKLVLKLRGSYGVDSSGIEFVHPFQFAGVSIVEDHESDVRVDPSSLAAMGEISVYAVRTRSVPGTRHNQKPHTAPEITSVEKVNEKALKGRDLTHVTKLGPRKSLGKMGKAVTTKEYDSIQKPFIHFRFLYRSKGALQNLGLIPFDFVVPPFAVEEPHSTPAGEMALRQEIKRLRAELESRDSPLKLEIKGEAGENSQQPKQTKPSGIDGVVEIIDLTGGD